MTGKARDRVPKTSLSGVGQKRMSSDGRVYEYRDAAHSHSHAYLLPRLQALIARSCPPAGRALDYGCGNGSITRWLDGLGYQAVGVDPSPTGIEVARSVPSGATFSNDVSLAHLQADGPFDLALCIEVIAHCFDPAAELRKLFTVLAPGGTLLLSTPFHGYWKYLALALGGKMEHHLDTLWAGACVHFFTERSIRQLVEGVGFQVASIERCGRLAPIARSMIVLCTKPL